MENQNNIRIIFTDKACSSLDDIIKKFNLSESIEEDIKRTNEGKLARIVIVNNLTKDFAKEVLSEKDMVASLQKKLEVSPQIAADIAKEIITKVIPLLEKISEDEIKKQNLIEKISIEPPSEVSNKNNSQITKPDVPDDVPDLVEPSIKKIFIPKKAAIGEIFKKPAMPERKKSSGPDNYREPLA